MERQHIESNLSEFQSSRTSLTRMFNLIITPGPSGIRTPVGGVISGRANHYTTVPLFVNI